MEYYSHSQWQSIAVFEAVPQPLGIGALKALWPLEASEVDAFVKRCLADGLIKGSYDKGFILAPDLKQAIRQRLSRINNPERAGIMLEQIERAGQQVALTDISRFSLLLRAGRNYEAALFAEVAARKAFYEGDKASAYELVSNAMDVVAGHQGPIEWDTLLFSLVIEFCRLKIHLTRGIRDIPSLLDLARPRAEQHGDLRTLARIDCIEGLCRYVTGEIADGIICISKGLNQVDALGDEDIVSVTTEFRGAFYYLRGMYKEALDCFDMMMKFQDLPMEKAVFSFLPEYLSSSSAIGYISALVGQYHRSIGLLDSHWRRSRIKKDDGNSCFYEALLGVILLIMGRKNEAYGHIVDSCKEAGQLNNIAALHVAQKGLAYYYFLEGNIEEAYRITSKTVHADFIGPQYNWPVTLEMLHAFYRQGYAPVEGMAFDNEIERVMHGPNIHLRGVACRIRAIEAHEGGEDADVIESLLEASEADLIRTGDPIELAKTRCEVARVKLSRGDRASARNIALMALEGLSGYGQDFFPEDLVDLLIVGVPFRPGRKKQELIDRFIDLMDEFVPDTDQDELLGRLLSAVCSFFDAERAGLFWFPRGRESQRPVLRASYNIDKAEVNSRPFREALGLIFKTYRNEEPLIIRDANPTGPVRGSARSRAVFCLPVSVGETLRGVLYLDNSRIYEQGDDVDRDFVLRLAHHVSMSVERIIHYTSMMNEGASGTKDIKETSSYIDVGPRILGRSPVMITVLAKADQAAVSDATMLITGETGVGKGLLAGRIHEKSLRKSGPFVVMDLSSIPETLVESDLFGHEKGAFTGAERRKPGRVELAHKGTLFIDEIGDVPSGAQVKLLRVLQEKSFVRVGGTRTIISDFRLIAATNRDLVSDVSAGRFRQDLYYRLNVVGLSMPALRERSEDIIILSREFLEHYSRKYHRQIPELTDQDISALMNYSWPGNVRELKNVMERAVILSTPERLELNLPVDLVRDMNTMPCETVTMDELQRRYIRHVLGLTGGRIGGPGGAAEILGMKRTTLQARMKRLGVA